MLVHCAWAPAAAAPTARAAASAPASLCFNAVMLSLKKKAIRGRVPEIATLAHRRPTLRRPRALNFPVTVARGGRPSPASGRGLQIHRLRPLAALVGFGFERHAHAL